MSETHYTTHEVEPIYRGEEERKENKPGKLDVEFGNETDVRTHVYLKNGARVDVEPLKLDSLVDSKRSQLRLVEERKEVGDDEVNDANEARLERIEQDDMDEELRMLFARIFREFGDQVGMVRKDKGSGLDELKIGNRLDLENSPVFVISESREAELRALIKNPPAENIGGLTPRFRVRPQFNYFIEHGNPDNRLGMMFYYKTDSGESQKVVFLFGRDKEESKNNLEQDQDTQYEMAA